MKTLKNYKKLKNHFVNKKRMLQEIIEKKIDFQNISFQKKLVLKK